MMKRKSYAPEYPSAWPAILAYILCAGGIGAFLLFNPAPRNEVRIFLAETPTAKGLASPNEFLQVAKQQ